MKSGHERQVAHRIEDVRRDHRERYVWARRQLEPTWRVLDAGCGVGYGSFMLAETAGSVLGVDVSPEAIEYARRYWKGERIDFRVVDLHAPEFAPEERFDCVVCFECLEHLVAPELFLLRVGRAMAPQAVLLLSIPNQVTRPHDVRINPYHVQHYTPREIRALLERAGFETETVATQDDAEVLSGEQGAYLIVRARRVAEAQFDESALIVEYPVRQHAFAIQLGDALAEYKGLERKRQELERQKNELAELVQQLRQRNVDIDRANFNKDAALGAANQRNNQLQTELRHVRDLLTPWVEKAGELFATQGALLVRLEQAERTLQEVRAEWQAPLSTAARLEDLERLQEQLALAEQQRSQFEVAQRQQLEALREQARSHVEERFEQLALRLDAALGEQAMQRTSSEVQSTLLGELRAQLQQLTAEQNQQRERAITQEREVAVLREARERGNDVQAAELLETRREFAAALQAIEAAQGTLAEKIERVRVSLAGLDHNNADVHRKMQERVQALDRDNGLAHKALRDRMTQFDRDNGKAHAQLREEFQRIWHDPAFHRLIRMGWVGVKLLGMLGLGRRFFGKAPAESVLAANVPASVAKHAAAPAKPAAPVGAPQPAPIAAIAGKAPVADSALRGTPEAFARGYNSLVNVYRGRPFEKAGASRIIIDAGRVFDTHLTGVGHYCEQLTRGLLRQSPRELLAYSHELLPEWLLKQPGSPEFVHCPPHLRVGDPAQIHRAPLLEELAGEHALYIHTSAVYKPLLRTQRKLSVVYDLAPISVPETVPPEVTAACEEYTRYLVATSQHFITDSAYTKQELVKYTGMDASKVDVVYVGLDALFRRTQTEEELAQVRAKYCLDEPYILCVGTLQPRKNLLRLVEAYALLREQGRTLPRLVLTGSDQWREIQGFDEHLAALQASGKVQWLGYVDRLDMPALYNQCQLFVYPSYFEGYGMPVAEAMASGAAVACGDRTSLPEVGGTAARYFDPYSVEAIAEAVGSVIDDADQLREMRRLSLEQAQSYPDWDQVANEFLRISEKVINSHAG